MVAGCGDVLGVDAYPLGCSIQPRLCFENQPRHEPSHNKWRCVVDVLRTTDNGGWGDHGMQSTDGMIYAIPVNATYVLKVCPRTEWVWTIGH